MESRAPETERDAGRVRVAAVQYQVRKSAGFEEHAARVRYFVETAASSGADFVVFPEFLTMELLSQQGLANLPSAEGIARLCDYEDAFVGLVQDLARATGVTVIAGSHPVRRDGAIYNVAPIAFPDGSVLFQPKLHITPSERRCWGIEGGSALRVITTPKAKIGVLICYDSEFPEAVRYLADEGVELLFVPYCTDDRQGHARVRLCCQARAIENQIFVVTAGIVGNLVGVPNMDVHYGQSAILSPSDLGFARDGVHAEADGNIETLLVGDVDLASLHRSRAAGSVTPRLDRRSDLFDLRYHLRNDAGALAPRVSPSPEGE